MSSHRPASSSNSRRRRYTLLAVRLALLHVVTFVSISGMLIARGDYIGPGAPLPPLPWLERVQAIFAAPMFYVIPERLVLVLSPILGNDTIILLSEAALNAWLWGVAIAAGVYPPSKSKTDHFPS